MSLHELGGLIAVVAGAIATVLFALKTSSCSWVLTISEFSFIFHT
jgi:hypothetical protein